MNSPPAKWDCWVGLLPQYSPTQQGKLATNLKTLHASSEKGDKASLQLGVQAAGLPGMMSESECVKLRKRERPTIHTRGQEGGTRHPCIPGRGGMNEYRML